MRKILVVLLAVLTVLVFTGCEKPVATEDIVADYLRQGKKDPASFTDAFSLNGNAKEGIEDLFKAFEYETVRVEDIDENTKMAYVNFKGYDIGEGIQNYISNYQGVLMVKLLEDYKNEGVMELMEKDPEKYDEIVSEINQNYFGSVMFEQKKQGKTYQIMEVPVKLIMTGNKKWQVDPSQKEDIINAITDDALTIWTRFVKSTENNP